MAASAPALYPQELEPRAYSNVPIGMNFALVGYGYTEGDVLADASVPIEDAEIMAHSLVFAYARSLNLLGDSGKIDAVIPYSWASGSATFAGVPHDREVHGFGDPALRLTWNFIGAPALTLQEFRDHKSDWIVGGSFRVGMPLGQYDEDKLLNIGLNRWSFKPELGISKPWGRWTFEVAAGATFYTDNDEFLGSSTREQEPLIAVQGHVLYSFGKGIWAGLDGTFYTGGRTTLNGTVNDDRQSSSRVGLTVSLPVTPRHSCKLYASTGATARAGGDFTTAGIVWQYRWGGKMSAKALETK
jgi:hypothetical protein